MMFGQYPQRMVNQRLQKTRESWQPQIAVAQGLSSAACYFALVGCIND